MRELTAYEIEEVSGAWINIFIGVAIGGISACMNGGGAAQILSAAAFGGLSGAYGNFAGAALGGARIAFATKSIASGLASGAIAGH